MLASMGWWMSVTGGRGEVPLSLLPYELASLQTSLP